jgi:hypothetical protein
MGGIFFFYMWGMASEPRKTLFWNSLFFSNIFLKCRVQGEHLLVDSMFDPPVTDESVGTAERFLVGADFAPDLLLLRVVDGVLVTCEIVGPGEDGVAGLAGGGVNALTFVRTGLRAPLQERR